MLEGVLESLLLHRLRLGDWIDGLDRSKLRIDLWSGSISLRSLTIRTSAFERFGVQPFKIQYGHIEEMNIQIPWQALASQPVKINVKGVYLLIATVDTTDSSDFSSDSSAASSSSASILRAEHRAAIEEAEHIRQLSKGPPRNDEANFFENMLSTIVANLQVAIEKLHIRIEHRSQANRQIIRPPPLDGTTAEPVPPLPLSFACGLTIHSISSWTISSTGSMEFSKVAPKQLIRKKLKITDLALYCNPNAKTWANLPPAAMRITFSNGIPRDRQVEEQWWRNNELKSSLHRCSFLLLPLSPEVDLTLNRLDRSAPYLSLVVSLPSLPLSLTDSQVRVLIECAEDLSRKSLRKRENLKQAIAQCQTIKPKVPPQARIATTSAASSTSSTPAAPSSARQWWRWSFLCLRHLSRRGRPALSILARSRVFRSYVPLWKRSLGASWLQELNDEERSRMEDYEQLLTPSQVMYFRTMSEKELEYETTNRERMLELEKVANSKRGYVASWYGYLTGKDAEKSIKGKVINTNTNNNNTANTANIVVTNVGVTPNSTSSSSIGFELTPEQREAIWSMIGPDMAGSSSVTTTTGTSDLPKEYVLYSFQFSVSNLTLDLFELDSSNVRIDTPSAAEGMIHLTRLVVQNWTSRIQVRPIREGGRIRKEDDDNKNDDSENSNNKNRRANTNDDSEQVGRHPLDATVTVEAFRLIDMTARQDEWSAVLARSEANVEAAPDDDTRTDANANATPAPSASTPLPASAVTPYFNFDYSRAPSDGRADHRIRARIGRVETIIVPEILFRIARVWRNTNGGTNTIPSATTSSSSSTSSNVTNSSAVMSVAASVSNDMQHEFLASLTRQRKWDVQFTTEQFKMILPARTSSASAASDSSSSSSSSSSSALSSSSPSPSLASSLLILSVSSISLTSRNSSNDDSTTTPSSSSDSTTKILVQNQQLPQQLKQHPNDFRCMNLDVQGMRIDMWRTREEMRRWIAEGGLAPSSATSDPIQSDLLPTPPTLSHLNILAPLSIHLSLHLCTRLRKLDVDGRRILLPRTVLSGILPNVRLSLTHQLVSFINLFNHNMRRANKERSNDDITLASSSTLPTKDITPDINSVEDQQTQPDSSTSQSIEALPPVRTQFHGFFGIGTASLTIFNQQSDKPSSSASSSSSSSSSVSPSVCQFSPLFLLRGVGCSTLMMVSSYESNLRFGCETFHIDYTNNNNVDDNNQQSSIQLVSITSKHHHHTSHVPGGVPDGHTSLLMRAPSALIKADDEALQLRVITLLGPALRHTPTGYLNRLRSNQYIDASISCIQVAWRPDVMVELMRWVEQIPSNQSSIATAPTQRQEDQPHTLDTTQTDNDSTNLESKLPSPIAPSSVKIRPAFDRFVSLLTARVDEFTFTCFSSTASPAASAPSTNTVAAASSTPSSPFLQLSLVDLYLKQGIYFHQTHSSTTPNDYILVTGIREATLIDVTNQSMEYREIIKCKVEPTEEELEREAFPMEDDDDDDDNSGECNHPSSSYSSHPLSSHLSSSHRALLPSKPFPLLLTFDSIDAGSSRYAGVESHTFIDIRGVSLIYLRQRIDRIIDYFTSGVLATISSSSTQHLASSVGRVWHGKRTRIHLSALHPTIILPRSDAYEHVGQHVQIDLGNIHVDIDSTQYGRSDDRRVTTPVDSHQSKDDDSSDDPPSSSSLHSDSDSDSDSDSSTLLSRSSSKSVSRITLVITKMNLTSSIGAMEVESIRKDGDGDGDDDSHVFFPTFKHDNSSSPSSQCLTPIIHDINFELSIEVTFPNDEDIHLAPHVIVRGQLTDVEAKVSRVQYLLLRYIAFDNLFNSIEPVPIVAPNMPPSLNPSEPPTDAAAIESDLALPTAPTVQASPDAGPVLMYMPPSITTDVQLQLHGLRVELLAPSVASSALQPFARLRIDQMNILNRTSDEHGIHLSITTRKLTIFDCTQVDNERKIFYPLDTDSSASARSGPIDEFCLTWARCGRATLSASPSNSPSPPPPPRPDRLTCVLSHPCILILPDFCLRFIDFVQTNDADDDDEIATQIKERRFDNDATRGGSGAYGSMESPVDEKKADSDSDSNLPPVSTHVGLVQRLYWLDMHFSVHNARSILPQSLAPDAPALVVTSDLHFTSSNTIPNPNSDTDNNSTLVRTQEVELTFSQLQVFGGTVDRPLVSNLAHRLCACQTAQIVLNSVFHRVDGGAGDAAGASHSVGPSKATTTATINLAPITLQVSYTDGTRMQQIIMYFREEFRARSIAKRHARAAKLLSVGRPSLSRHSSHPVEPEWASLATAHTRELLHRQQAMFQGQVCVIVPQAIDEETEQPDESEIEETNDTSRTSSQSPPILSFGWFQLVELNCASVSIILLNDLAPSVGLVSTGSVPVCHLCLFDCRLLWTHPRAHSVASLAHSTDMVLISIQTQLSLTAYDIANVEWINVLDQCGYEVSVEWQTQQSLSPNANRVGSAKRSLPTAIDTRQSISIRIAATQPQEIQVSDRLLTTLLALQETIAMQNEPTKNNTSSSSSSSSSTAIVAASHTRSSFFSPFVLRNSTSTRIRFRMVCGGAPDVVSILPVGVDTPIALAEVADASMATRGTNGALAHCSFEFEGNERLASDAIDAQPPGGANMASPFKSLMRVPVSKIGVFVYELARGDTGEPSGTFVQIIVSMVRASKQIELKSLHSLTNATNLPIEVRLLPQMGLPRPPAASELMLGDVEPGATIFLPLDQPNFVWSEIQFRPTGFGMNWNTAGTGADGANNASSGLLTRQAALQSDRSVVIGVCRMAGSEDSASAASPSAGGPNHIPAFVCHAVMRQTKHMASIAAATMASNSSGMEGIMTYSRVHIELNPPLSLSNLFLCDMTYQLKYRAAGADLLTAGLLHPGDVVWLHDVELRLYPLVRFMMLPYANAPSAPKQVWSEWIGMEQVIARPIVEYIVPIQQPPPATPVPLVTQIHRSMSQASGGTIAITFMTQYWLNNQSSLSLAFTQSDELYENERFIFFKWRSPSLPTDRDNWSSREGASARPPPQAGGANLPPSSAEFEWLADQGWTVDIVSGRTDEQGWEYAIDFPGPYRNKNSALDAVRRRRWFRYKALKTITTEPNNVQPQSAVGDDTGLTLKNVRMYGSPSNQSPILSVYAVGGVMPPSTQIDVSRAATDSILVLASPRSHRAPGNAVPSFELAVHVDSAPAPFSKVKVLSFHPRYKIQNATPLRLRLRQLGLDPRNGRFISTVESGAIEHFHPWIVTPPVGAIESKRFGMHIGIDDDAAAHGALAWTTAFPIQRIGEFTVRLPMQVDSNPSSHDPSLMVASGPAFFFRVKIELIRAVLHVSIMPESSFLTQPSSLQRARDQHGQSLRSGGMYRIDNHTPHQLHIYQQPTGRISDPTKRTGTPVTIVGYSAAPYAFEQFDLDMSNDEQSKPITSHAVSVYIDRALSEADQLHQFERDFNGLDDRPGSSPLCTVIGFDDVGAESSVKLPDTYTITPIPDSDASTISYRAVQVTIQADGPTRVMVVREVEVSDTEAAQSRPTSSGQAPIQDDQADGSEESIQVSCSFSIPELNLILFSVGDLIPAVASRPAPPSSAASSSSSSAVQKVVRSGVQLTQQQSREVCFIQLVDLTIAGSWNAQVTQVQLNLARYQVDNPIKNPTFPVPLYSIVGGSAGSSASSGGVAPTGAFMVFLRIPRQASSSSLVNGLSTSPFVVGRVLVRVGPASLSLDEDFMRQIAVFTQEVAAKRGAEGTARAQLRRAKSIEERAVTNTNMDEIAAFLRASVSISTSAVRQRALERMYYFRRFEVGTIKLRVSYTPTTFVPTIGIPVDPIKPFHAALGSARPFLDCDDAPLTFTPWQRLKLFTSLSRLRGEVGRMYAAELTSQSISLLGRAKTFGNPLGLLSAVEQGWRDLVSDPNITRGAKSFVNHTAEGMSQGTAGLTSALGSNVAKLSTDKAYQASREANLAQDRPGTVKAGMESGFRHLGAGFVDGLTGLVSMPVAGAKSGGFTGAMKGTAQGMLGLFVKPIAGTLDAVSKVSQGVRAQAQAANTAGTVHQVERNGTSINSTTSSAAASSSSSSSSPAADPSSGMWRCAACGCFNARASTQCSWCKQQQQQKDELP